MQGLVKGFSPSWRSSRAMLALALPYAALSLTPVARLPVDEMAAARVAANNLPPSLRAAAIDLAARKIEEKKKPDWRGLWIEPTSYSGGQAQHVRESELLPEDFEGRVAPVTPMVIAQTLPPVAAIGGLPSSPRPSRLEEALIGIHRRRQREALLYCERWFSFKTLFKGPEAKAALRRERPSASLPMKLMTKLKGVWPTEARERT